MRELNDLIDKFNEIFRFLTALAVCFAVGVRHLQPHRLLSGTLGLAFWRRATATKNTTLPTGSGLLCGLFNRHFPLTGLAWDYSNRGILWGYDLAVCRYGLVTVK